jgi:hypothetical protein
MRDLITIALAESSITSTDIAVIVFCAVLVVVFLVGIIKRVRNNGVKSMLTDAEVLEIKKILINQIGDILANLGVTEDYETFKNAMIYEALHRIRKYIDEKGGILDTLADDISDDTILEIINEALQLSDLESTVKNAYDALVKKRINDIENAEDEAAAMVDDDGFINDENAEEIPTEFIDLLTEPDSVKTDGEKE